MNLMNLYEPLGSCHTRNVIGESFNSSTMRGAVEKVHEGSRGSFHGKWRGRAQIGGNGIKTPNGGSGPTSHQRPIQASLRSNDSGQ
jgi:hypothetical protein